MKKNYENNQFLITTIFLFLIVSSITTFYILNFKYRTYKIIDSIVISNKCIKLITTNSNIKLLNQSEFLYIDNKKIRIKIILIERNILKKNNKKYHEVLIKLNLPKKYKENDYVKLTIYNNKEKVINIFKSCWKEAI